MIRSLRPLFRITLHLRLELGLAAPRTDAPAPTAANDPEPRVWTLPELAERLAASEFSVARVARDLGYAGLVFDADQAAAIAEALERDPPPRSA